MAVQYSANLHTKKTTWATIVVYMGASNLFTVGQEAKKLGVQVEKGKKTWLKTINSKEVPTVGIAQILEIPTGQWTRRQEVEVIPLNDLTLSLG